MAGIPGYSPKGAYASQPTYYPNLYPHLEPGYGQSFQRVQRKEEEKEEDEESLSEAESVRSTCNDISFSRAQGLACGGMLLMTLIACVPLLHSFGPSLPWEGGEVHRGSPQELFRSQELADVATDNVIAAAGRASAGRRLQSAAEREQVLAAVVAGFKNIDDHIRVRYPSVHRGLCEAHLSPAQREAVLNAMRHMKDPRVQNLGRSLLQATGQSKDSLMLKVAILKHVQSFFREARTLRDEIVPASLRQPRDGLVDATDVDKMQLLRSFNKWYAKSHPAQQQAPVGGRRLFVWPFPGNMTFTKTPLTVEGQGLVLGGMANKTVEYVAGQGAAFFHQIGSYFSYLGLDNVVDNILGGQEFEDFKSCAAQHLQTLDPTNEAKCFSTFANAAYDEIMNTNFSKIMKQKFLGSSTGLQSPVATLPSSMGAGVVQPLPTSSSSSSSDGAPSWWTASTHF